MANRNRLRANTVKAWIATTHDYNKRLINSESGLQSLFFTHLRDLLAQERYVYYFEPRVEVATSKGTRCHPDLVICEKGERVRHVVGMVEFKYAPRSRLNSGRQWGGVVRDFEKFRIFTSRRGQGLVITADRYWGPAPQFDFELAKDALICWAGVYAGPSRCEGLRDLTGDIDDLHVLETITTADEDSQVWVNGRKRG